MEDREEEEAAVAPPKLRKRQRQHPRHSSRHRARGCGGSSHAAAASHEEEDAPIVCPSQPGRPSALSPSPPPPPPPYGRLRLIRRPVAGHFACRAKPRAFAASWQTPDAAGVGNTSVVETVN